MATKKKSRSRRTTRRPRAGFSGVRQEPLKPEQIGGTPAFGPDRDREPLASGGARRGEALQEAEEEDDFEDGRSSGGLYSRSQEDQWARGDVGSRAVETPSGYLSVEGGEGEEPGPVEPRTVELPQRRAVRKERRRRRAGGRSPSGRRPSKSF